MNKQRREERRKIMSFTPVRDLQSNILLGYLGDLTLQGAMMVGEKLQEINRRFTLAIDFHETPEMPATRMTIPVRVAWCKQEEQQTYYNTGFEFLEMTEQNKKVIETILERYRFLRELPA